MTAHEDEGPAVAVRSDVAGAANAADALEQRIPAVPGAWAADGLEAADRAWEADEGDAVEQSLEVGFDDEREHEEEPEPVPGVESEDLLDPLG